MTDNLTWQQIHTLLNNMTNTLEHKTTVTRTIPRINYNELLSVLTNRTQFKYDKNLELNLNIQDNNITIHIRRKKQ